MEKQRKEHITVSEELQKRIKLLLRRSLNDIKVEALDEFDKNFEREAFFNQKWARRKYNDDTSRGLLVKTGALCAEVSPEKFRVRVS